MNQRRIYNAKTVTGLRAGSGTQNQQFSDLVPAYTDAYDIGSSQLRWRQLYATLMTIYEGLNVNGIVNMEDLFLQGDLQVLGRDTLPGNLFVTGNSQLVGNTTVNGNLRIDGTLSFGNTDYADIVGNTALIGNVNDNRIENSGGPANQSSSTIITPRLHGVGAVTTPFLNVMGYALADQFATTRQTDTTSRLDTNAGVRMEGGLAVAKTIWGNILRADQLISTLDLACSNTINTLHLNATGNVNVTGQITSDNLLTARTLTSNGGSSTPAAPVTVFRLHRAGVFNQSLGNDVDFQISRFESSLYTSKSQMNISLWDTDNNRPIVMTMRSNGCVGINNAAPTVALDVVGAVKTSANLQVANGAVIDNGLTCRTMTGNGGTGTPATPVSVLKLFRDGVFGQSWPNEVDFQMSRFDTSAQGTSKTQLNINLWDLAENAPRPTVMTLRSNGRVGINNSTPTTALDVNGTVKCTAIEPATAVLVPQLLVNAPASTATTEFVARFNRSNSTNGHMTLVGVGTEGSGFNKCALGFWRQDSWDRGDFFIANANTANGSDLEWLPHRRMTISSGGFTVFNSTNGSQVVSTAAFPFQVAADYNGGYSFMMRNYSQLPASSAYLALRHGDSSVGNQVDLDIGPNHNLNESIVRSTKHLTLETLSGNIRINAGGSGSGGDNGNVVVEATKRVILKSPTEISLEANTHVFRNSAAQVGVSIRNNSIGFSGSSFRFGIGPNGNLAILNSDDSLNRYI